MNEIVNPDFLLVPEAGSPTTTFSAAARTTVQTRAPCCSTSRTAMLRTVAGAAAPMTKDAIAAQAGVSPTSSGLTAGLKELCAMELIEKAGGVYRLAEAIR